jgi:hypothetical protein
MVQDLFDLELADNLKVGSWSSRFRHNGPVFVSEQADGFGTTGVDPEYVHLRQCLWY